MAKRITQSFIHEVVDGTTGEVVQVETKKTFTDKIKAEHFYMTFLDYIAPLYKLKGEIPHKILTWLCERAIYNSGKVILSTGERKELCQELDITNPQLSNNLKKLKELNLISGDQGNYQINPQIFWKGDMQSRRSFLEGKSLQVSFEILDQTSNKAED